MEAAAAQPLTASRAWLGRTPRVPVVVAIALAGAALCAFSIHVATRKGVPDIQVALLQWISIPYIAAGLIAWWRRPESRMGVLMIAVGFSTGILCLQFTDDTLLWSIGALADIFAAAAFIHVTLAYPSGRLRSRAGAVDRGDRLRDLDRSPGGQAALRGLHPGQRVRRDRRRRRLRRDRAHPAVQRRAHLPRRRRPARGAPPLRRPLAPALVGGAAGVLRRSAW